MPTTIEHQGSHDSTPKCRTCFFWAGDRHGADNVQGECHRYPPKPAGLTQQQGLQGPQIAVVSAFPMVNIQTWCGEFRPRNLETMQ